MFKPMLRLFSTACLFSVVFYGLAGTTRSLQPTVRLTSDPPLSQLLPFEAEAIKPQHPARLTLQVFDSAGRPLDNAKVHVQILAPAKNPWLPTDFPVVEGTKLLDLEAYPLSSKLEIQQMLPIRGTYEFQVHVTPMATNAFAPWQQTLQLPVAENWVKYRNFGLLAAILLGIGLGGGWVLGGQQRIQPAELLSQRVRLLLSGAAIAAIAAFLFINISTELAESHSHTQPTTPVPRTVQSQGLKLRLLGDTTAIVGQPARLAAQVTNIRTGQPVTDVNLQVITTALEDGWTALAYQSTADAAGKLAWQQQFFDGSPHKVKVTASPKPNADDQFRPFTIAEVIEVEGVAPPLLTRLIVLGYLTDIVVLGLFLGVLLHRLA